MKYRKTTRESPQYLVGELLKGFIQGRNDRLDRELKEKELAAKQSDSFKDVIATASAINQLNDIGVDTGISAQQYIAMQRGQMPTQVPTGGYQAPETMLFSGSGQPMQMVGKGQFEPVTGERAESMMQALRPKERRDIIKSQIETQNKEEIKRASENRDKEEDATTGLSKFKRMYDYADALRDSMAVKYGDAFNEAGAGGMLTREYAKFKTRILQENPQMRAFDKRLSREAYEMARSIEGGKVTDQDVRIVLETLMNPLGASREEDYWNAKMEVESWIDKGAKGEVVDDLLREINSRLGKRENTFDSFKQELGL